MKLEKLLENVAVEQIVGEKDLDLTMVCYHSREAKPGGLFVAIDGFKVDGHAYISHAIEQGCACVVVEKPTEFFENVTIVRVADSRKALALITANFYQHLDRQMHLYGVTGTKGKTSTAHFIQSILDKSGQKAAYIGTTTDFSQYQMPKNTPTTPEILEIFKILSQIAPLQNHLVMEVTSHALSLDRVYGLSFDCSVFTNLAEDHLDFHQDMEDYFLAKRMLFEQTQGPLIINADDAYGRRMIDYFEKQENRLIYTYGMEEKSDFMAENIVLGTDSSRFALKTPKAKVEVALPLMGRFNIANALAAAACAYACHIDLESIKKGLEAVGRINGRVEKFRDKRGFDVVIDFAHTPDSLEKIILAAKESGYQKVTTIFGLGGERYRAKRKVMGEISGRLSDFTILTEDNSRGEDVKDILKDIQEGMDTTQGAFLVIPDREEAIQYGIDHAKAGEVVLILGKGHEDYQIKNNQKIHFDEHEIIAKYMK